MLPRARLVPLENPQVYVVFLPSTIIPVKKSPPAVYLLSVRRVSALQLAAVISRKKSGADRSNTPLAGRESVASVPLLSQAGPSGASQVHRVSAKSP